MGGPDDPRSNSVLKGSMRPAGGGLQIPQGGFRSPWRPTPGSFWRGRYQRVFGALRDGRGALVRRGVFPGRTPGPRGGTSLRYESPDKILLACPLFGAYWRRRVAFRQFILAARFRRRCVVAWLGCGAFVGGVWGGLRPPLPGRRLLVRLSGRLFFSCPLPCRLLLVRLPGRLFLSGLRLGGLFLAFLK
jgi:hypothetical protein